MPVRPAGTPERGTIQRLHSVYDHIRQVVLRQPDMARSGMWQRRRCDRGPPCNPGVPEPSARHGGCLVGWRSGSGPSVRSGIM